MQGVVDGSIVVSLEETRRAMRVIAEKARVIAEGAGALPVAAALSGARGGGADCRGRLGRQHRSRGSSRSSRPARDADRLRAAGQLTPVSIHPLRQASQTFGAHTAPRMRSLGFVALATLATLACAGAFACSRSELFDFDGLAGVGLGPDGGSRLDAEVPL